MSLLVGVDIGTQSLKVVVVDEARRIVGRGSRSYGVSHPQPGHVEQDPLDWERALAPSVADALAEARRDAADVSAMGVCGQLDGCIAVNGSGDAVSPCLIWMDRRAHLPELPADFRQRTGLVADPGHMAAKIAWLMDRGLGDRFHQPVSYLVERLTGAVVMDRSLASTTMLVELGSDRPAADLLHAFGIDAAALPAIGEASDRAGTLTALGAQLTGLRQGIPVAVGTGDDFATPLGAGITAPGDLACVLGTAEVVGAVSDAPVIDESGLVETHAFPGGRYFVENPGWLSGGAVAWARRLLGFDSDAQLDAAAAAVSSGSEGVLFVPALTGAMSPRWRPSMSGCFSGLRPWHERAHLARAVLEGTSFAMADVLDGIIALGLPCRRIVAMGGGAQSSLWSQIRANLARRPLLAIRDGDSCARGAALLAAVMLGEGDLHAIVGASEMEAVHFEPRADPALDESRHAYRRLFETLDADPS